MTTPPRATLADLIDRHRADALAVAEAQARLEQTDAVLKWSLRANGNFVEHDDKQWFWNDDDDRLWWGPIDRQPLPVPDARTIVVPAEVLREAP